MGNRIISISRQFGSGGHEIAVKTAGRLGLKVYERELVRLACDYGELPETAMTDSDEKATNPYLFQTVHEGNYHVLRGKSTSEVLFALQSHEIRRIARKMEQEHLTQPQAARLLRKMDKQRRKYYETYTHHVWGDSANYDLCIDTSACTLDEAAARIADRFRAMA